MKERGFLSGRRALPALVGGALLAFACDSGGGDAGCGGCGDEGEGGVAYVFPEDGTVMQQAAQVHLTESGLAFIEDNVPELLGTLLGEEGLSFCVERQDVEVIGLNAVSICHRSECDDGTTGCQLEIGLDDIRVTPNTQPDSDYLSVELGIVLEEQLTAGILGARCLVDLTSPGGGLPVGAQIYFDVDGPPGERVSIRLPSDGLSYELDDIGIRIRGERVILDAACGLTGAAINLFKGALIGVIEGLIDDQVGELLGTALCTTCEATTDCPTGSSCNGDGVCQIDGSDECVPLSLGLETEFDLGGLLADFAPGLEAKLGILFYLANYADMVGPAPDPYIGIDLAGQVGFDTAPSSCVPWREPPSSARYPKSPVLNAETRPDGGAFAAGIGLAVRALDLALWNVYISGTLCLEVGTETVEQISTATLGALLPSLSALAEGENRPMTIALRPQQPPRIELGDGEISYDADGNPTVVSPLLTLRLEDLDLDFYAFIESRNARVFTLEVDLAVPLALDVNADNQLVILLPDDLTEAIESLVAKNGELMTQNDLDRVATVLPGLIGGLLPALTDGLIDPIDLPEIEGIQLKLDGGSFQSIDDYQMLAIYADLELAATKSISLLQPTFRSVRVQGPGLAEFDALRADLHAAGPVDYTRLRTRVELDMETLAPGGAPADLEYSYRINNGHWTFWRRNDRLIVDSSVFLLQGRHQVEVRVREQGRTSSVSPLTVTTDVVVDYQAPTVAVHRDGELARVDATDVVSPSDRLELAWRVNGGAWAELDETWTIDLAPWRGGNALVEVRATDERGHAATTRKSFNLSSGATETVATPAGAVVLDDADDVAGCSATGRSSGNAGWMLAAFGMMLGLRRRRAALVAGAAASALLLSACGDDKSTGRTVIPCDPACEDGQLCVDGACVPESTDPDCSGDEDCEGGLICVDGTCVTNTTCTSAADCDDLQLCEDGVCVSVECIDASDCEPCPAPGIARCDGNTCACDAPCAEGCAEGTACCYGSNSCVEVTAECAAQECPVGTRLEAVADPVFDNGTCTASTECGCVDLPPLPLGHVGRWLEAAVSPDGTVAAATAYNATYGDLMVGLVEGDEIAWRFIDGLPATGAVTGNLAGPRGGIAIPGDNVGLFPSIAVEDDGTAHVAYQTRIGDARTLRYARGPLGEDKEAWVFIDLDVETPAGEYTQIVLDGAGSPLIVYSVPGFYDEGADLWTSQVRTVRASTDRPDDADDFGSPFVVENIPSVAPCGGSCVGRQACRADTNACEIPIRAGACDPGCGDGESCFDQGEGVRVCAATASSGGLRTLRPGAGQFTDARWIASDRLGIAHYDASFGILRFVELDTAADTVLTAVTVDGEGLDGEGAVVSTGDVGAFPSIWVDEGGDVVIAYSDATRGRLLAWTRSENTISIIDDGVRCYEYDGEFCIDVLQARVGSASALAFDAGTLSAVYHDATQHFLMEAPLGPFGWEIAAPIAGDGDEGAWGFYNQHLITAGGRIALTHRMRNAISPGERDVVVTTF